MSNETQPIRIQRSRKAGWRMPQNTVYVGRPTRFGNPFFVSNVIRLSDPDMLFAAFGPAGTQIGEAYYDYNEAAKYAVELFRELLEREMQPADKEQLRGKNLACWCKAGDPCHADVLLEYANQQQHNNQF